MCAEMSRQCMSRWPVAGDGAHMIRQKHLREFLLRKQEHDDGANVTTPLSTARKIKHMTGFHNGRRGKEYAFPILT